MVLRYGVNFNGSIDGNLLCSHTTWNLSGNTLEWCENLLEAINRNTNTYSVCELFDKPENRILGSIYVTMS